jgi:hypothetical protein
MHTKNSFVLALLSLCFFSFSGPGPTAGRTYNLVYVDNSKSTGSLSLNGEMIQAISRKLDSVKADNNASLLFYLSNSLTPELTRSFEGGQKLINKMYNSYYAQPNSVMDKRLLREQLFGENLSGIGAVNINFYVTESYLANDLMGDNSGLMINFLPREIQSISRCDEDKINVYIYYPKNAAGITPARLKSFSEFGKGAAGFDSKIRYHFVSL